MKLCDKDEKYKCIINEGENNLYDVQYLHISQEMDSYN